VTPDGIELLATTAITEPPQPLGVDDGLDTQDPPDHTYTPHGVVEMIPGVAPPLLWTINRPMLEDAFRATFADLGAATPPNTQPIVARFRGRAALDLTAICDVTSSLPGGDPAEVQRQYLGEVLDAPEATRSRAHVATAFKGRRVHKRIVDEVDLIAVAADGVVRMEIELYDMPVRRLVAYRQRIRDLAWRGYAAEVGASSAAGATYRALELLLERWLPEEEAESWTQIITKGALDLSPVGGARARGLEQVLDRYTTDAIRTTITDTADNKRSRVAQLGPDGTRFLEALDRAVRAMGSKAIYGDETWDEDQAWVWRQLQLLTTSERQAPAAGWTNDFAALRRHLGTSKRWRRTRIITGQVVDLRVRWLRRQIQETIRFLELRERAKNALLVLGGEERRIIVEAGRRLVASGQIPHPDAVRFLTDGELERMLFGLCGIDNDELDKRRRINHNCATAGPLPDWFVGRPSARKQVEIDASAFLRGWAASPGRYTGPVRIITSLADGTRLQPGEVLVAHSTDPSWTPLFLVASAVVLEVGGPLSHAAIVAREFGLPAVLNVRDSTRSLAEGETVTVDGNEGRVERHDTRSAL
jgi:pyruvate,water dikinase